MRSTPSCFPAVAQRVVNLFVFIVTVGVFPSQAVAQTTFDYDNNGNLIARTDNGMTTEYLYDIRNQLAEVRQGSSILARFQYDHEGRLIQKIGNDGIRQYAYDGPCVLAEYDQNGVLKARYQYAGKDLVSVTWDIEGRRWVSTDGLGSVTTLTDDAGVAVASYHFDAWGRFRFIGELGASLNRVGFTGYRWDEEVKNYDARARRYDPTVGRFTTRDTHSGTGEDPPSLNPYAYARGNPTRYIDPTGHYEADVHYGLTKALALKAGFSEQVAEALARGTEAPDRPYDPRDPVANGKIIAAPDWLAQTSEAQEERREAAERLRTWHFPIDPGKDVVEPGSPSARTKFVEAAHTGNPIIIGETLHPFEDSWSHQGKPSLKGIAGHPKNRGGLLSPKADLTHEYPTTTPAAWRKTRTSSSSRLRNRTLH